MWAQQDPRDALAQLDRWVQLALDLPAQLARLELRVRQAQLDHREFPELPPPKGLRDPLARLAQLDLAAQPD